MIIYGTKVVHVTFATGEFLCPSCGQRAAYAHKHAKLYFTLFFIPLVPLSVRDQWVECGACAATFKVDVLAHPGVSATPSTGALPPPRASAASSEAGAPAIAAGSSTPVAAGAGLPFGLALVGLCTCPPLSWVGGAMALRGILAARAAAAAPSGLHYAAVGLSVVSVALTCTGLLGFMMQRSAYNELAALNEAAEAGRQQEALDAATACTLTQTLFIEDPGLAKEHGERSVEVKEVDCTGAQLGSAGAFTTLEGVAIGKGDAAVRSTVCFTRRSRWFAVDANPAGCPDTAASWPPPDASVGTDERAVRKAHHAQRDALDLAALTARFATLAQSTVDPDGELTKPCDAAALGARVPGAGPISLLTVMGDALTGQPLGLEAEPWDDWMTTPVVHEALVLSEPADRARAARTVLAAPLLAVLTPVERAWPVIDDDGYESGGWFGLVQVHDASTGDLLCHVPLSFQSSESVSFTQGRLESEKGAAQRKVEDDLQEHYGTALTAATATLSPRITLDVDASP